VAQYVKDIFVRDAVNVGVITTLIVPATSLKGYESAMVFLANPSTDELNADVEVSPDGLNDWKVLPDDAFRPLAAGASGYTFVDGRFQYFRVRGLMSTVPGSIWRSVFLHRTATHK
jgi:hypothetical protein